MSKKKKILKVFLVTIASIVAVCAIIFIGAYSYFNFYILPKLMGNNAGDNAVPPITFSEVAKELTDKQVVSNIINFDKQSASEMLVALNELGEEVASESQEEQKPEEPPKEQKEPEVQVPVEGDTAYQRIMNQAEKSEISEGLAIIAKVDIAKVNELRRQGKNSEIKAYIKSVLTSEEISTALTLYHKYKHLL